MDGFKPSVSAPDITTLVGSLIRHLLTIGATLGVVHGTYSDSAVSIIAGALVGVGMICWALYQKIVAARADHAGSVASAQMGKAVQPK